MANKKKLLWAAIVIGFLCGFLGLASAMKKGSLVDTEQSKSYQAVLVLVNETNQVVEEVTFLKPGNQPEKVILVKQLFFAS